MRQDTQHTPGPFHVEKRTTPGQFVTDTLILDKHGDVLANLHCNTQGNAPLFAAAPDLLAALQALLLERYACEEPAQFDSDGHWTSDSPACELARAAIAKATNP